MQELIELEKIRTKITDIARTVYPMMIKESVYVQLIINDFSKTSEETIKSVFSNSEKSDIPFVRPVDLGESNYYIYTPNNNSELSRLLFVPSLLLVYSIHQFPIKFPISLTRIVKETLEFLFRDGRDVGIKVQYIVEEELLFHLEMCEYLEDLSSLEIKCLLDETISIYSEEFRVVKADGEKYYFFRKQ
ncbi:hypothetical protein [Alkalihalobacterium elongatum]|uniref:hypothetical protein n=1 Tax=Alkalihalobacterium elongatum TaxID=2675466 RepID=UPI001C1FFDD0|nr:hypothetical protein [Alkalihalobacterium elongatum]